MLSQAVQLNNSRVLIRNTDNFLEAFYIKYECCNEEKLRGNDKELLSDSLNLMCILNENDIGRKNSQI